MIVFARTSLHNCDWSEFETKSNFFTFQFAAGGAGHTSISLTGILVREQISTTQKSRMTLNSNPKNRMTQDAMFVEVRINMKSYYDFMFFSTVCSSCKGFECVTQKLEDPKNSWQFVRPKIIAEILQNPEK